MIAQIEQAIIEKINAARLGYALHVASYSGEFEDDDARRAIARFPAAWVSFLSEAPADRGASKTVYRARFAVMLAARSLRNERAQRHGTQAGDVGLYQIMADVCATLDHEALALDAVTSRLTRARASLLRNGYATRERVAVAVTEWTVDYLTPTRPATKAYAPFRRVHVAWDFPPHGNIGDGMPPPNPDAQDFIELPHEET